MAYTIKKVYVPAHDASATNRQYHLVDVQINDGKISAMGKDLPVVGEVVDGENKLLMPGFVNGHTHSIEMWTRGLIEPVPLEIWLPDMIQYSPVDPESAYLAGLITGVELLLSGATTVLDHFAWLPDKEVESVGELVRGYKEAGIRAVIAPLVSDLGIDQTVANGPSGHSEPAKQAAGDLNRPTAQILKNMRAAVEKYHRPAEGISIGVGPTGIQKCSDELFKGCIALSKEFDLPRHTHLLETKNQSVLAHEKFGCSAVKHLEEMGWFNAKTTCAHSIHLTEEDMKILHKHNATIVTNPVSNCRLGSGICPVLNFHKHGVNVAVGCDGAASNDSQDMLEALKLATMLPTLTEVDWRKWPSPYETYKWAAVGGARGIGMGDQLGEVAVGKVADVVLYDLTTLSFLPHTDPVMMLVYGRHHTAVSSVWVAGKRVVKENKVVGVNVDALRKRIMEKQKLMINENAPKMTLRELTYNKLLPVYDLKK